MGRLIYTPGPAVKIKKGKVGKVVSMIEETASGAFVTIPDGADGVPLRELKVHIDPVQEGSGTPTPENVRPVTGRTGLNAGVFGKNWLPAAPAGTWTQDGITFTSDGNGGYTYIGKSTAETSIILDVGAYILPASGYIHLMNSSTSNFISFGFAYNGTALDPLYSFSAANRKVQLNNAHTGMKANQIIFTVGYNINVTALRTLSPMVLETNDLTPFTPYGRTISVDWEDEAGTVYSGIYDVMTGILTVDSARVMLADLAWTENAVTEHAFDSKIPDRLAGAYTSPAAYSNIYKMYTAASLHNYTYGFGYGTGIILYVKDDRADTPADMVQLFQNEGTYIVYKLASPVTYRLDPVQISTVYGENHFWADTGDVDVIYRADTKMYIDRQVADLQALILEN